MLTYMIVMMNYKKNEMFLKILKYFKILKMSEVARPVQVPWYINVLAGTILVVAVAVVAVVIGTIAYYMPKCCCGWGRCWC